MRNENDRLLSEVEKLKNALREQITRTQAGVRLDLNLEKGRIRDEASVHELKIKEVGVARLAFFCSSMMLRMGGRTGVAWLIVLYAVLFATGRY